MKPGDYYSDLENRTSSWSASASTEEYLPFRDVLVAATPFLSAGKRLLDIGCQGGHQTAYLAKRFEESYGLDIADYSNMWCHHPQVRFLVHDVDAAPIPFPDGSFSTIVCLNVLEHVFDVFGLVKELARLVEPGGTVLIMVPNAGQIRHILSLARGRVPRTGANTKRFSETQGWDGQHLHYFTVQELSWLLTHAGLRVEHQCITGRLRPLKAVLPSLLCSDIVLVATNPQP
jgi:SAM-dependent methyltransferase